MTWNRIAATVMASALAGACGGSVHDSGGADGDLDGSGGAAAVPSAQGSGGSRPGSAGGAPTGAGGLGTAGGGFIITGGRPGDDPPPDSSCASVQIGAEVLGTDLLILLDQSSSMNEAFAGSDSGETKWDAVTDALAGFTGTASAVVGIGLQYFGLPAASPTPGAPDSCDATDYETLAVPVGLDAAAPILASLAAHGPGTLRPTVPALEGALHHMMVRTADVSYRVAAVVLITDGPPTTCESQSIAALEELAQRASSAPSPVRTYVVGLGAGRAGDEAIARAGGTGHAFVVQGADVREQITRALLEITSLAIPCEIDIPSPPSGETFDPNLVNIEITAPDGESRALPYVARESDCATIDAWHYDDPAAPTRIELCPAACNQIAGGRLTFLFGCATWNER
jgi:hypothetical protein